MSEPNKVLLTVEDVRKITGLGRDRVYEFMHSRELPTMKVGRKLMVHEDHFYKWLKNEGNKNSYYMKK
ncbi:helix-turn-helix domain-containing protein [Alteribacillus sp. YIM 98480]|uniref:helix-turn-helix domain-containing protein n=1 Tax=Alteribacillus sp. YIM 98480 TaxID=2606599 RepID=UPI00131E2543|nr:helix-turn-helix domain-containing protein [Alteribacillus sp. YIM 98480]